MADNPIPTHRYAPDNTGTGILTGVAGAAGTLGVYWTKEAPVPSLVLELLPGWRSQPEGSGGLRIWGDLDTLVTRNGGLAFTLRLEVANGRTRIFAFTIDGQAVPEISSGTEVGQLRPASWNLNLGAGNLEKSRELIDVRIKQGNKLVETPLVATPGSTAVALLPLLGSEPSQPSQPAPFVLLFSRTVRPGWRQSGGGITPFEHHVYGSDLLLLHSKWVQDPNNIEQWQLTRFTRAGDRVFEAGVMLRDFAGAGATLLWNNTVRAYHAHLEASTRYPSTLLPLVFPEWVPVGTTEPQYPPAVGRWALLLGRAPGEPWALLRIRPLTPFAAEWEWERFRTHEGAVVRLPLQVRGLSPADSGSPGRLADVLAKRQPQFALQGDFSSAGAQPLSGRIRIDSLDFDIAAPPDKTQLTVEASSREGFLTSNKLEVAKSTLQLRVSGVRPGAQDDDPAFDEEPLPSGGVDCEIAELFRGELAVTVPLRSPTPKSALTLLLEQKPAQGTQTGPAYTADLLSHDAATPGPDSGSGRVVVFDRQPFLIAVVEYRDYLVSLPAEHGSGIVARWSSVPAPNLPARRWLIGSDLDEATVILPPQAVAEEMETERTLVDRDTTATHPPEPLDYRIGSAAKLGLDLGDAPAFFRMAPWNISHLFESPAVQLGHEPSLRHLQVELLYGLRCDVRETLAPLRIADLARRLGPVPGELPRTIRWEHASLAHARAYNAARRAWGVDYNRYRSRLALLEPFPDAMRYSQDTVVLPSEHTRCELIPVADADAVAPATETWDEERLRGGALRGVESRNIYQQIVNTPVPRGNGKLSELGLSALGGFGHVEASFANGLSRITARVEMGRTSEWMLERKGRIAVFWNRARHVIIYRRSVVPSEQFGPVQTPLLGRAVLRKVEEYVEFEEESRRFPDTPQGEPHEPGCVTGCHVPKGTKVKVRSAWGRDVGTVGWEVPLWNPAAAALQPDIYPKPRIDISVVRAGAQRPDATPSAEITGAERPAALRDPEQIFFFTRTDTTDPVERWGAVEEVDYAPLQLPDAQRMPRGETPAAAAAKVPDEPVVPGGFERFTFRVASADEPVNVTAGRASESINARLEAFTLLRGPASGLPAVPGEFADLGAIPGQVADAYQAVEDLLREVQDGEAGKQVLAWLANPGSESDPLRRARVQAAVERFTRVFDPASVQSLARRAEALGRARVARAESIFNTRAGEIVALHRQQARRARQELLKRIDDELVKVGEAAVGEWLAPVLAFAGKDKVAEVRAALGELEEELLLWLQAASGSPETALHGVHHASEAAIRLLREWESDVKDALALVEQERRTAVAAWMNRWSERVAAVERQVAAQRASWLPELATLGNRLLEPLRAGLREAYARLEPWNKADLRTILSGRAALLETRIRETIRSLDDTLLGTTEGLDVLPDRIAARRALAVRVREIRTALEAVVTPATVATREALDNALRPVLWAQIRSLQADLASEQSVLAARMAQLADEWWHTLSQKLRSAGGEVFAEAAGVEAEIRGLLKRLERQTAETVRGELAQARGRAEEMVRTLSQLAARDLRPLEATLGRLRTNAESAFRLARAGGWAPEVSQIRSLRERLVYHFPRELVRDIGITPTVALVNRAGEHLKALGLDLPVDRLRERLVPADILRDFRFNQIFKDFAGLRIEALFSALGMPDIGKNIRVQQGADPARGAVWLEARIDEFLVAGPASLFNVGPLELILENARFEAVARISSSLGGPTTQEVRGAITGNWQMKIGGTPMLTFVDTALSFASPNQLRFHARPSKIRLNEALQFISDVLNQTQGEREGSGLTVSLTAQGVTARLETALDPIQLGTVGISNLRIGSYFGLFFGEELAIEAGAFLARRDAPFALTIAALGGGGYLDVQSRYSISTGRFSCRVSLGIMAAAQVGIALGPIKGSVFVALGFTVDFAAGGPGARGLRIGILFVLRGEVSVLGYIDIMLVLELAAVYDTVSKRIEGYGRLSLKIKICWCFTIKIKTQVRYTLGCDLPGEHTHLLAPPTPEEIRRWACDYVYLLDG